MCTMSEKAYSRAKFSLICVNVIVAYPAADVNPVFGAFAQDVKILRDVHKLWIINQNAAARFVNFHTRSTC